MLIGDGALCGLKVCTDCKSEKQLTEFSPDKRARDGRQGRCRDCANARKRERYPYNRERILEAQRRQRKENPDRFKEVARNSRARNREKIRARNRAWYERVRLDPDWQARNKEYRRRNRDKKRQYDALYAKENSARKVAAARAWVEANRNRRRAIGKRWQDRNREAVIAKAAARRSRQRGAPGRFTRKDIEGLKRIQRAECAGCSCSILDDYHVDHIIPIARGGSNWPSNLQLLCGDCNRSKSALLPIEWKARRRRKVAA